MIPEVSCATRARWYLHRIAARHRFGILECQLETHSLVAFSYFGQLPLWEPIILPCIKENCTEVPSFTHLFDGRPEIPIPIEERVISILRRFLVFVRTYLIFGNYKPSHSLGKWERQEFVRSCFPSRLNFPGRPQPLRHSPRHFLFFTHLAGALI